MIRVVHAAAVECDHHDGDTTCDSVLLLRTSGPSADRSTVLAAAAARGWSADGDQLCPKHRTTTPEGA